MKQDLGCIFPGQGSQKVGMLRELAERHVLVRDTFAQASDALDYDLWELVQNGEETELSRTAVTQPAILTASVAVWRAWREQGGAEPALMAGHSLGEYSALVCAGALDFAAAVALVRKRGEFMQSAVPAGQGGMAAIVGLDDDAVVAACAAAAEGEVVEAVNFNSPGQVVIAGHTAALARAIEACKAAGAKRALPLAVSAPFHCSLMKPAAERFAVELAKVDIQPPRIPVLQNYDLSSSSEPERIRDNLVQQIHNAVPWVETVRRFGDSGITRLLEIGPGKVLAGLVKRSDERLEVLSVNDPDSLAAALGHQV